MRILGLDFGSKTIGVAVCDPFGWTAQGLEIIRREEENNLKKSIARISELCREYAVESIVLGLPKNMNNTEGERVEKTLAFKKKTWKGIKIASRIMGWKIIYCSSRTFPFRSRFIQSEKEKGYWQNGSDVYFTGLFGLKA